MSSPINEADKIFLGSAEVDAVYSGDVKVWPSIVPVATAVTLSHTPDIPAPGQLITITADIVDINSARVTEGEVQFYRAGVPMGGPQPVNALGSVLVTDTAVGTATIEYRADYLGAPAYDPSSSSIFITPTMKSVSLNINSGYGWGTWGIQTSGAPLTVVGSVNSSGGPLDVVDQGTVQFYLEGVPHGAPVNVSNGRANLSTTGPAGREAVYTWTATYHDPNGGYSDATATPSTGTWRWAIDKVFTFTPASAPLGTAFTWSSTWTVAYGGPPPPTPNPPNWWLIGDPRGGTNWGLSTVFQRTPCNPASSLSTGGVFSENVAWARGTWGMSCGMENGIGMAHYIRTGAEVDPVNIT